MEADLTPTAHLALPMTTACIEDVNSWFPQPDHGYSRFPLVEIVRREAMSFKETLVNELRRRLDPVMTEQFYRICSMLSPTYRRMPFLTQQQVESCRTDIVRIMRQQALLSISTDSNVFSSTITTTTPSKLPSLISRYSEPNENQNSINTGDNYDMSTELETYLRFVIVNNTNYDNPITFWLAYRSTIPHLFTIAMEYLHVPMSSASCERIFSAMDRTVIPLRSSLKPETSSMLIFFKEHKNW